MQNSGYAGSDLNVVALAFEDILDYSQDLFESYRDQLSVTLHQMPKLVRKGKDAVPVIAGQ